MTVLLVVGLALLLSAPARAQTDSAIGLPPEAAEAIAPFFPERFTITSDPAQVRLYTDADPITGRAEYVFQLSAESAGNTWDATFEVDARSHYVAACSWNAARDTPSYERLWQRDFVLSRPEAEEIAWAFVSARWARRCGSLQLAYARDPLSPHAGPPPAFAFRWEGRVGDAETGDWAMIQVSANTGEILTFRGRPALDYSWADVVIPREQAIAVVREFLQGTNATDLGDVRYETRMVLSHPQTPGEGPAWHVIAIRPPKVEGDEWDRRLVCIVDARAGDMLKPPPWWEDLSMDFFDRPVKLDP